MIVINIIFLNWSTVCRILVRSTACMVVTGNPNTSRSSRALYFHMHGKNTSKYRFSHA